MDGQWRTDATVSSSDARNRSEVSAAVVEDRAEAVPAGIIVDAATAVREGAAALSADALLDEADAAPIF